MDYRGQLSGDAARVDQHDWWVLLMFDGASSCGAGVHAWADDSDRAHMHNFNEFVMKQRSRWDAV